MPFSSTLTETDLFAILRLIDFRITQLRSGSIIREPNQEQLDEARSITQLRMKIERRLNELHYGC